MGLVYYNASVSWTDAFAAADMNALADTSGLLSTGTVLDNTATRNTFVDLNFTAGASITPTGTTPHIVVYMLPVGADGSTYPSTANGTTTTFFPAAQYIVGAIGVRAAAATHIGSIEGIRVGPTKYKFYIINRLGVAMAATLNTLKYSLNSEAVA